MPAVLLPSPEIPQPIRSRLSITGRVLNVPVTQVCGSAVTVSEVSGAKQTEAAIRAWLLARNGILKTAKLCGICDRLVKRIKAAMADKERSQPSSPTGSPLGNRRCGARLIRQRRRALSMATVMASAKPISIR